MADINLSTFEDDLNIRGQTGEDFTYTDFGGTDTYTLVDDLESNVVINDSNGARINLPEGFVPSQVQFASTGVQFTINGFTVTINTADTSTLTFVLAGTPLDPSAGTPSTLAETAEAYGSSVPDSGASAPVTNPGIVQADGTIAGGSGDDSDSDGDGGSGGDDSDGDDGSNGDGSDGGTGSTQAFTTGTDDLVGTPEDDFFAGTVSNQTSRDTFQPGDKVDGKGGSDTLEIELSGSDFDGNVDIRNIEKTFVETTDDVAREFEAETLFGKDSDVSELWVEDISNRNTQAGSIRVTDIRSETITLGVKDSGSNVTSATATADVEFEINQDFYQNGGAIGLALNDAENVAVDITTGSVAGINTVNVLSIGSTPTENTLAGTFAADGNADTMTVVGDKGFTAQLAPNFTSFNAATASGPQVIGFLASDDVTATGGTASDIFKFAEDGDHDVTTGDGDDTVVAPDGNMVIDTGDGHDKVDVGNGNMDIATGAGNDDVSGGDGDSTVALGEGDNVAVLGNGNMVVTAGSGNDSVTVGAGDHNINVDGGNNTVATGDASSSSTTITAGGGDDDIDTGDGAFTIDAGDGTNNVNVGDTNSGATSITTGSGTDTITTGDGTFTIKAGDGSNSITVGESTAGLSTITGGTGSDTVSTGDGTFDISTDGGDDDIEVGDAGSGTTSITAGTGNDVAHIDDGDSDVDMGDGDDELTINSANFLTTDDELDGGAGDDEFRISVNPGDDIRTSETRGVQGFETIALVGDGSLFEVHDELLNGNNGVMTVAIEGTDNTVSVEELSSVRDVAIEESGAGDSTVVGTDEQLDGFDHVALGAGFDVLEVVDEADLSADDLEEISGVDRLQLTSDSNQSQTWTVELTNELFSQSDDGSLTIAGDANVPANSLLRVDISNVQSSSFGPGQLQVINSANLNVAFVEDGSPVAAPSWANVQAGLTLTSNTDILNGPAGNPDKIDDNDNIVIAPTADVFNSTDVIEAQGQNPYSLKQGGDTLKFQFNIDLLDDTGVANVGTFPGFSGDSNSGYLSQVFGEDVDDTGSGGATVDGFERISFDFPDGTVPRDVSFVDDVTGDPVDTLPGPDLAGSYFLGNGNISDTGQVVFETDSGDDYITTFQWNSAITNGGDDTVELFQIDGMPDLPVALQPENLQRLAQLSPPLSDTPLEDRFDRGDEEPFARGDFPFGEAADVDGDVATDPFFDPDDFFDAPNNPFSDPADTLAELGLNSLEGLANIWDYGGSYHTGDGEDRIVMNSASIQAAITTLNMGQGTDILELRSWDALSPDGLEQAPSGNVVVGPNYFADDSGLNVVEYASLTDNNEPNGTTTITMTNADMDAFEPLPSDQGGPNTAVIRPVDVDTDRDGIEATGTDTDPRQQGPADDNRNNGSLFNNAGALELFAGAVSNGRFEVLGTSFDDEIVTGAGDDIVNALGGDNIVTTNAGDDDVETGFGDDQISTGDGDDDVDSLGGDNVVTTGDGNDDVTTGSGVDDITTGNGDDSVSSGDGPDTISTGDGNDAVNAGGGDDVVTTGNGDDTVNAGAGDDEVDVGDGDDTVDGEAGNDVITAGAGDDFIRGGLGNDTATGGAGNDTLIGDDDDGDQTDDGNDTLIGGAGNDTIDGQGGDDTLTGNQGDDDITAGEGEDIITAGTGGDSIDLTENTQVQDTLVYETGADGGLPGAASGYDFVTGFAPGTDKVQIDGTLLPAIDDASDGLLFATQNGVINLRDGANDEDAIEYTASLNIQDGDLVQDGFDLVRNKINNIGVESAEEEQGLFVVQGQSDTGLYLYNENVGSDADIDATEFQILALFDNALLTQNDFTPLA